MMGNGSEGAGKGVAHAITIMGRRTQASFYCVHSIVVMPMLV